MQPAHISSTVHFRHFHLRLRCASFANRITIQKPFRVSRFYSASPTPFYYVERLRTSCTSLERYNTIAGLNAGFAVIMANAPLATAHGGTAIHDPEEDSYSATLKCHDANCELYFVNFSRDRLTVMSYSADAILTKVETWADTIAGLA